jgi:hypothetical protein
MQTERDGELGFGYDSKIKYNEQERRKLFAKNVAILAEIKDFI